MAEQTSVTETLMRAVAVVGLIAILLLGAWGIIQIAFALPAFFAGTPSESSQSASSSIASSTSVAVSAPSLVTAGQPFTLSWQYRSPSNSSTQYGFAIAYSCTNGVSFTTLLPTGALQTVPCNTPFNFTNASQSITLTPVLSGKQQAPVTFSVAADILATGAIAATGSANSTVLPTTHITASTPAHTPSATYVAASPRATRYGLPDLRVTINSVSPAAAGRDTVQFTIQNVGTNTAPAGWLFTANIPANGTYVYQSQPQPALGPGDKIVYSLGFDLPTSAPNYNPTGYCQYQTSAYQPCRAPAYPTASNCGYSDNYTYNGTYNYPGVAYGCSPTPTYYAQTGYQATTPNWYGGTSTSRVVNITVDPQNQISESSKVNNTASVSL